MLKIWRYLESQLALSVNFEEFRKFTVIAFRYLRKELLRSVNLTFKHTYLETHHGKEKPVSVDIEVLVYKIEAILFAIIAKNVMFAVCVAKLDDFAADKVADASS